MRTLLAALFIVFAISGCAPMPGDELFETMTQPTAIEDIPDFQEKPQNLFATIASCYAVSFKVRPLTTIAMGYMGVPILGCCDILLKDGKIAKCHAYYPTGDEYIRKHELKHCQGYKDKLL